MRSLANPNVRNNYSFPFSPRETDLCAASLPVDAAKKSFSGDIQLAVYSHFNFSAILKAVGSG